MKSRMLLASSVVAGLSFLTTQGTAQSPGGPPEFVPSQVLVQFRADATPELRASARARVRGVREEVVVAATRRNDGKGDLELVRIPPGLAVSDAARGLAEDSAVELPSPIGAISIKRRPTTLLLQRIALGHVWRRHYARQPIREPGGRGLGARPCWLGTPLTWASSTKVAMQETTKISIRTHVGQPSREHGRWRR